MENILSINSNSQRTVVEIDNTTNEISKATNEGNKEARQTKFDNQ